MSIAGFSNIDMGAPPALQGNTQTLSEGDELKNEFLTLMVAQIQNQNPLEPLDGADYVSQLAQFSQVESSENLTKLMQDNTAILGNMQALSVASLVNERVWIETNQVDASDGSMTGELLLNTPESPALVTAIDAYGNQAQINLGALESGQHRFEFDVQELGLAPGPIRIDTSNLTNSSLRMSGRVNSVSVPDDGGAPMLSVEGVGDIPFYKIAKFGD